MNWAKHYDAIYKTHSVSATLTLGESNEVHTGLRVIDKTKGVEFTEGESTINSISPACAVRVSDLASRSIDLTKLRSSKIAFNGGTWRIENRLMRPSPDGEANGEVYLILIEDMDA